MTGLSRKFLSINLRTKIVLVLSGLVLIMGFGGTLYAKRDLSRILTSEAQETGLALAQSLAQLSAPLLLTDDIFALYEQINSTLLSNSNVRYVFILSPEGRVLYHTFGGGIPLGLKDINPVPPGKKHSATAITTDQGGIIDIAVPILEGQNGTVRLGFSQVRQETIVGQYISFLLLVVLLVAVLAIILSHYLSRVLTRPISALAQGAREIMNGQFSFTAAEGGDEIGQLGQAFNRMTAELSSSRRALLNQNRELTILNKLSDVISNSLKLEDVLSQALANLKDMMKLETCWVLLKDEQSGFLKLADWSGLTPSFTRQEELACQQPGCICSLTLQKKTSQILKDRELCPLYPVLEGTGEIRSHFSIPLLSKTEPLGILNLSPVSSEDIDSWSLAFLDRIGQQIGLAVERARLYQEVRRREELHASLLNKLITAQEEERKRIARELHDDVGQVISHLASTLGGIGEEGTPGQGDLPKRLAETKADSVRALHGLRRTILNLRPTILDDLGLVPAIRWYLRERLQEDGTAVSLEVKGLKERLAPDMETTLFRVIQEAITNVSLHAQAKNVKVRLELQDGSLTAEVSDDGVGFDAQRLLVSKDKLVKLGLLGMEERVNLLNGSLKIVSSPGNGTRLSISIPVPAR